MSLLYFFTLDTLHAGLSSQAGVRRPGPADRRAPFPGTAGEPVGVTTGGAEAHAALAPDASPFPFPFPFAAGLSPSPPFHFHSRRGTQLLTTLPFPFAAGLSPSPPSPFHSRRDSAPPPPPHPSHSRFRFHSRRDSAAAGRGWRGSGPRAARGARPDRSTDGVSPLSTP